MSQGSGGIHIVRCSRRHLDGWTRMRHGLWPHLGMREHRLEAEALLGSGQAAAFLACMQEGQAVAFAEAALRHDYVNGCATSPVAFLEGLYVLPEYRRLGAARLLCEAVEEWASSLGCSELASDVELHNTASQAMHEALGFDETERVVFYRKVLPPRP